ncbi:MAG: hypothetical protein OXI63_20860, partial [Candidatus Poribacteria bacterium]|nr:hypothetical protein [Candidatus Poribacteria bacterium]
AVVVDSTICPAQGVSKNLPALAGRVCQNGIAFNIFNIKTPVANQSLSNDLTPSEIRLQNQDHQNQCQNYFLFI